ncbi:DUF2975 domain-containing protein [Niabella soli]|uniref:DUF2975 domain-containing protein n=1 Tax=Niabella soli DSM 19437 TaxID=929713 RepID=W0F4A4_9BACT|nr:DUF2975 domain-containing protein [Niabella soli]AHF17837.1 hypothetical protein NIASO_14975 [Niabella soli DSM 19437]
MKQRFKVHESSVIAFIILILSVLVNLVTVIINARSSDMPVIESYRQIILPLNILDFVKAAIIFWMAWLLFRILKNVSNGIKWSDRYFRSIKRIGWLSVLIVVLDAITTTGRNLYIYRNTPLTDELTSGKFAIDVLAQTLFASPIAWFLILCVFLLADLLRYAGELKTDSESII